MKRTAFVATTAVTLVVASSLTSACGPDVTELQTDTRPDASGEGGGNAGDAGPTGEGGPAGLAPVSFARDLRPILDRGQGPPSGCRRCHYKNEPAAQGFELGGLDLTTLGALRQGGVSSSRTIVVAGDPNASALIQKLEGTYARGARMPKDQPPLSREEIDLFRRWIAEGAQGADSE